MRLGVLTTSYPRHAGDGAGQFVRGLCQELHRRGAKLEVLAADDAADDANGCGEPIDPFRVRRMRYAPVRAWQTLFYRGGAPDRLEADPSAWLAALGFGAAQL